MQRIRTIRTDITMQFYQLCIFFAASYLLPSATTTPSSIQNADPSSSSSSSTYDRTIIVDGLNAQTRDRDLFYTSPTPLNPTGVIEQWLIVPFVNSWLEHIHLASILHNLQTFQPFPGRVVLRWTYPTPTLQTRLSDYKQLVQGIDYDFWETLLLPHGLLTLPAHSHNVMVNTPCPCHDFHAADGVSQVNRCDGHVVSGNQEHITSDRTFLDRLNRGSSFREPACKPNFKIALASLSSALEDLISSIFLHDQTNIAWISLVQWQTLVLDHFGAAYLQLSDTDVSSRPFNLHGNWFNTLDKTVLPLQRIFTFTVADKSRGNMVATCRNFYVATLVHSIASQPTFYNRIAPPFSLVHDDLLGRMIGVLHNGNLPSIREELWAYFYILPKLHKTPTTWRPIVAAHNCSTTTANRVLSAALRLVLSTLQRKYAAEFQATGLRKLWLIENSLEFVLTRPEHIRHIFSSDINSMYTNLDQTFVINAVSLEILNAANHVSTTYVKVRLHTTKYGNQVDSAVWSNSRAQLRLGEGLYSLHQLNRLLDFVVKHVFFKVGNALFRQTQGIPMGGNSSPFLANLALLHLERTFVEKYPNTTLQHSIFRYLDDFAVVNHPEFAQISVYKLVYPDSTGIQLISNTPKHPRPNTLTETQFLDLDIWVT